ncbi:Hypothetical predicted protein [Mytilus galloprovincialis]|uniref:Endonuclease/exonuclease/phosphatase domain-containing protein n=1 Tax=Mytilus galloprovincialis TaxID=29158 RepID=A0A8B6GRZ0_MYTGA|nr:Hypothetical predicted protein [Mytilus galloprovincialis]
MRRKIKQICSNCDNDILDSDETVCDSCNNVVHLTCIATNCTTQKCQACFGLEIQDQQVKKASSYDTSKELDNDHDDTIMKTPYVVQTETPSICIDNKMTVEKEQNRNDVCINQSKTTDDAQIKFKDLRQLELKLKKREDDIRLREMRNSELNAENIRLQSTIIMQETKIKELENTIRILNRKIVVLEDTESESKRTDANSPVQNCCHQKCVTETDNLLLAMRERMTKLILQKVDAQINQLESEQIPVQSTVINDMLPKGNTNETLTKEHVYTNTSTEHRGTVRNSEAIPLAMNVIHQSPQYHVSHPPPTINGAHQPPQYHVSHPPPAINVVHQPPLSRVSQPSQYKYYTASNKEGNAMQQHPPSLTNNSNMFTSGKTLTQRKLAPARMRNVNSDFKVYHLNILSFNCKNIKTCDPLFSEILFNYDIVLLQEHWLFDCQLPLLDNVHIDFNGIGKAVDSDDPLPPTHLPRGYGGVCILWKKTIDHKITKVDCTNNRIQCIEITNTCGKDILVICVYMPCKDNRVEKLIEFLDCTEQLHSLCSQYNNTHHIVIGGDINENIIDKSESKRYEAVRALMDDHCLYTKDLGRTFINYKHEEISSIDYIFLDKELFENNSSYLKLDSCSSLVSDHYPITCRLNVKIEHRQQSTKILPTNRKIKWSTIDVNLYEENVNKSLTAISSEIQSGQELTKVITQVNTIMKNAAIESAPRAKVYKRKKQKPKIRSFKTNQASKRCKEAFAKWKANERPTSPNNKIYCDMKFAKYELRKTCRIEIAMKVLNDRQEILDARTKHDQVFYKLLGKKKKES